jgi:hypothetical protein
MSTSYFLWFERRHSRRQAISMANLPQAALAPLRRRQALLGTSDDPYRSRDNHYNWPTRRPATFRSDAPSRSRRLPLPPDPLIVFYYASKLSFPTCWTCNSNLGDDLHAVSRPCFSVSTQPTIDAPTLILSLTTHQSPNQLLQPIHDHLLSPANSP